MAALTGNSVASSYSGLVKTTDNGVLGATEKNLTDGAGNASTLSLGTGSASFTGVLDLTGASVLGGAGLESGTGSDSMQSAASLTTNPASAQGANSIAIGDNAVSYADNSIVIGTSVNDADAVRYKAISIGNNLSTAQYTVNIGLDQNAYGANGVCIGEGNSFGGDFNVAVGYQNVVTGGYNHQLVIGSGSTAAGATGAVAIGHGVSAGKEETVSVKALETQTPSTPTAGGIVMKDAGSTERRINITAAGGLQIDGTPVGGGGGGLTGLSTTTVQTHAGPDTADTVYYELVVPANTFQAGDIVQFSALAGADFTGGGWIYDAAWISASSGAFPGDVAIGGHANTAGSNKYSITWNKTLYIHTSDGTGAGTSIFGSDKPIEQVDSGAQQYMDQFAAAIDWTANQYFAFSAYVDNAGSQIDLTGVNVVKINA